MTLQIGSPVLAMRIQYTVLGGKQNVKMMPHPEPFAGSQPDLNDHFYASSKGQVRHASFQDNGEGDVYLPLDEADHWAAICDLRERHTLINTFTGPMELLDIYLTKTSYTLEPYTRQVEGLEEGRSLTMDLAYWSCYNLDAVHYADNEIAGEMLLQKDLLGRDEALKAKIAMVSAAAPSKVDLLPRILDAAGRIVRELPAMTVESTLAIARPQVHEFAVADLPDGPYLLAIEVRRPDRPAAVMKAAFRMRPSHGCLLNWFQPADDYGLARHAVLGRVLPSMPAIERVTAIPDGLKVSGTFRAEGAAPAGFETILTAARNSTNIDVQHTLTPQGNGLLGQWSFCLPLAPRNGPRMLKTTVGNDHLLPDVWRLDNSGEYYWGWLLSDKMRWPKWRIGGLLVDSRWHYRIWKSNRVDTSATTTYEGTRSPGWLDVSDGNDWGVTAVFPDGVMSAAPKGITFDAESGVLTVSLQPSQSLPRRIAVGDPPRKAHFRLEFHTTRFPTRYQPELTDVQYRRLLESVKDHWCFNGNIMVYAGLRPDLPKDAWIPRLIEADMPPSALLRTYEPYLAAALQRLGKDFAPSSNKEDNIRRLLHFYRTGKILPPPTPIVPGPGNAPK